MWILGAHDKNQVIRIIFKYLEVSSYFMSVYGELFFLTKKSRLDVSGIIEVKADANDNIGVTEVIFYVNGFLKSIDVSSPYGFSLNTAKLPNGSHILMARAYDAKGNNTSSSINIEVKGSVADTIPPEISITSPANDSEVSGII